MDVCIQSHEKINVEKNLAQTLKLTDPQNKSSQKISVVVNQKVKMIHRHRL